MKHFLLSLLFTVALNSIVNAQTGNISGKITMDNGESVAGAVVNIKSLNKQTITDEKGNYAIKGIAYGSYTLEVGSMEILTKKQQITINKAENTINVSAKAREKSDLQEVTVQGKTEKKKMETSGFAVAIIETKEASLRNLTTNELLDRSVGVRVRQNGGEGSPIEYNLNGMSGSTIGLFLDGIEISTYGSSFNLNNIPPSMIERIEVYKGVLPSHLSGNYIGGAINVIMKKDASANNITASASYGSFNTYRGDISGLYRNPKNGLTVRASGFFSHSDNDYEMWGKFSKYTLPGLKVRRYYRTKRPNDKFETVGGRFEFGFSDVKWADQFFIGYNVSDTYKEIPHGLTMTKPYFGRFNEYQAHVVSLNYSKNNLFVDGLSLNVNAVHSRRSTYLQDTVSLKYNWDGTLLVKNAEGPPETFGYEPGMGQQGEAVISNIDRTISNIRSNLSYMIVSGHRISLNHKFENSDRNDQDLLRPARSKWITLNDLTTNIWAMNYEAEMLKGRLKSNVFGKYAIYQTNQTIPLGETNGVISYNYNSTNRNNQGFGGTLSYEAVNNGFVIVSAEKSFIMPTDRHIYGEPENNLLPNADILPELAINYNVGARYGFQPATKHKINLYGNMFWRNGYDKIIQQTRTDAVIEGRENQVEDIQVTQFVNLSKTQSVGFEAEINYIYDNRLNAMVNFSKFNSLFKVVSDENGNPHSLYNAQVPNEPFFTVNANIQYRFKNIFQKNSNLNVYYNSGYVAPFSTIWIESEWFTTPTQFTHDLGASYRFPSGKLVASLDAKNILNGEIYDNFGVQKPGRAFYIKLNYTINNFK
ncbi:TonB-dependent receptor [Pedobacter xixiisoli]|uniref:Outer membrane receptor proteins, mostly Fe transport n=1 Tax=Pedobacter xixiisoli TaxID=1476464 RepID=A0A286A7H5_9SPHI|nr:carboxypeptidase-like regulatory domain-containing protein [Pedobacter xixiisoli]SOD17873.1 Outer membrane receptor proteins, mostly Fe transport [Pedobacter xixiisoli]